ncbi:MAG: right-handed parallel beta-helix repeat-containing protein [Acidimicrobiia bacterium]
MIDRRAFLKRAGLFVVATACTTPENESTTTAANAPATTAHDHSGSTSTAAANGASTTVPFVERTDILRVEGSMTIDESMRVPGIVIEPGATLTLAPNRDITLETSGNVLVLGTLASSPAADVIHTVRFVDIDESKVVGGGMDLLETDVGIWVMEGGRLELNGTAKTAWSYEPEQSWLPDDEIVITPTASGNFEGFITTTAAGLAGKIPAEVGLGWKAELLNLTRNVRVEASPEGRAHILIRSTSPQTIRYVSLTNLGLFDVLGRYPLHFHHSGPESRGSVVEGVVAKMSGRHAFVPHMSEGITFTDCIAFDTTGDPFWWDEKEASHDIVWERCVAALVRRDDNKPNRLSGFLLGGGDNNVIKDSVAVGVLGGPETGGIDWPASVRVGDWAFSNNISHNNEANGFWVWQNQIGSTVEDFVVYHNGLYGISHGAYNNSFVYRNGIIYGNLEASIRFSANGATYENLTIDGAGITEVGILTGRHPAQPDSNTLFLNSPIVNHTGPKVLVEEGNRSGDAVFYDFVGCGVEEADVVVDGGLAEGSLMRVQDGERAFAIDDSGAAEDIETFVPDLYSIEY